MPRQNEKKFSRIFLDVCEWTGGVMAVSGENIRYANISEEIFINQKLWKKEK